MHHEVQKHIYLPRKDRSHWQSHPKDPSPLAYLAWGQRDFSKDYIPPCRHEGWVCTLIEEGNPTIVISDKPKRLRPGSLIFIGPDCSFGWASAKHNSCKLILWMWTKIESTSLLSKGRDQCVQRQFPRKKWPPFLELGERCRREVLNVDSLSANYLTGCQKIFEVLLERALKSKTSKDDQSARIHLATAWIKDHLDSKEPIARLCDYLNLSQTSLYRLFKSRHDCSPATYVHRIKMEHARIRLRRGKMSVKELAFELGYRHFNDFSRAYKSYFGRSPTTPPEPMEPRNV